MPDEVTEEMDYLSGFMVNHILLPIPSLGYDSRSVPETGSEITMALGISLVFGTCLWNPGLSGVFRDSPLLQ